MSPTDPSGLADGLSDMKQLLADADVGGAFPQQEQAVAYMVQFLVSGEPCEELFRERWRAEAFAEGCLPSAKAQVIALVPQRDRC